MIPTPTLRASWLVLAPPKFTRPTGADIVMESIAQVCAVGSPPKRSGVPRGERVLSVIEIFANCPQKTGVLVGSAFDSTFQDVHVGHDQDLLQGHSPVINAPHHAPYG
jgi:hypothetical protein